ncbi:mRNA export factor-like [Centruroides vittatus]|uniref:mRNA export factor-like n=1 Tax=Centruroides vittatus TaxID=120091 RepID=UPI003510076A
MNCTTDIEVTEPSKDTISCLAFTPVQTQNFLVSGSWDNELRCWEIRDDGSSIPKAIQFHQKPVLDITWSSDGTKLFSASCDETVNMWDLNTNQLIRIGQHKSSVKTVDFVTSSRYSYIMTGSWDRTLKFWDSKSPNPVHNIDLPERCYCAFVKYPMAVVGLAGRTIIVYDLEGGFKEYKRMESPLPCQIRCLIGFVKNNKANLIVGGEIGAIAVQCVNVDNLGENFYFRCHRREFGNVVDVYPINGLALHPLDDIVASVGSDGRYVFWDLNARCALRTSNFFDQSLTSCCFNSKGDVFAYSLGYDWSKGHEFNNNRRSRIYLHRATQVPSSGIKI